jgi:NADPH:quinone reductase-like Zn-dependent oxidoreductase
MRESYRRRDGHLSLPEEAIAISKPNDVLLEIQAVALNFRDTNILHGTNPWAVKPDGIPCSDAAAVVVGVGSDVKLFKPGDRVSPIFDQHSITGHEQSREWLGGEVDGILATHCIFPEDKLVKLPTHLSSAEAAYLPCAGLTAWSALTVNDSLQPGISVLIQGTGGVSMAALKIARAAGCSIILTSSSGAKLTRLRTRKDH